MHWRARRIDGIVGGVVALALGVDLWLLDQRGLAPGAAVVTLGGLALALVLVLVGRSLRVRARSPEAIDRDLVTGHLARSWDEARSRHREASDSDTRDRAGISEWLAVNLRDQLHHAASDVDALPPRRWAYETRGLLALFLISLLLWLGLWFGSGRFGVLVIEDPSVAAAGSGAGLAGGGSGPGDAQGEQDRPDDAGQDESPGEASEGPGAQESPPDPNESENPDPAEPESPEPPPDGGAEDPPSDSGEGDGSTPGLGGPEDPLELPVASTFVLPEFVGEGAGEKTMAPVAGLDEEPAAAAPSSPTESPGGTGSETEPKELDPIEFSRAEEWPLRARHVPPVDRPSVARWFTLLQEVFR